jgi:hypothetical protein
MRIAITIEGSGPSHTTLTPLELTTAHGAAYELGMRETGHGMPVQPFPDG